MLATFSLTIGWDDGPVFYLRRVLYNTRKALTVEPLPDILPRRKQVTPVTERVTPSNKPVTRRCACGCGKEAASGSVYFDNACKQKAYRDRKRKAKAGGK